MESTETKAQGAMDGVRHTFADNRSVTIAEAINAFAAYEALRPIAIATGYFNPGGFIAISDTLERAPSVRILIGAEPEPFEFVDRLERDRNDAAQRVRALESGLAAGRDLLSFSHAIDDELQRLLDFLARKTTEVRIYRQRFLHGKAFVFGTEAAAIAGSANFTRAGLLSNYELDLGHFDPDKVAKVSRWFEELWVDAEPFDLAALYRTRFAEYDPYRIYLRMLYEYYGAETEAEGEAARILGTLRLAEFQRLGSRRAQRILNEWHGALIADGVGLGKTYVAGDIIERYSKDRGEHVLVVCPAALRSMWELFRIKHNLPLQVVSYTQLASDRAVGEGDNDILKMPPKYYRLIVADEAHMLRSPDTGYYGALRRLMQLAPDAHLLLLTATPVNNSIRDLYHPIALFARNDAHFATIGIQSLVDLFSRAEHTPVDELDPSLLFPLLDAIAVRRPRSLIRKQFPNATLEGPNGPIPIVFPTARLQRAGYDLNALQPGLFARVADAIENRLTLARYRVPAYALDRSKFSVEATRQETISGLLRSQLLKRFESSIDAFRVSARKIATASRHLAAFVAERHAVPIEAFDPFSLGTEALPEESLRDENNFADAGEFDTGRLQQELRADAELLESIVHDADAIQPQHDPKLEALIEILAEAGRNSGNARKTLVFTTFSDTLEYVKTFLQEAIETDPELAYLRGRVAFGTGDLSAEERVDLAVGFAPRSMRPDDDVAPDRFDLLISTDILSEGQNLQQCGRVVNYDLPWNPMRIAQRNGRVDRIGSPHECVSIVCFFPDTELDRLLGLERMLLRKIAHANAAVGAGAILPDIAEMEHAFADDEIAIRKLYDEDATIIDSLDVDDAYLGEIFREELRKALLHESREQYERLPWGAGSGFAEGSGDARVVYLARVGGGKRERSELVSYVLPEGKILHDRLRALRTIQCLPNTPRYYPAELRDVAITGWENAREAILSRYKAERDPSMRQSRISKAQRMAITLLQRAGTAEAFEAAEALTVPWPIDVQRRLRTILNDPGTADSAKVRMLVEFVAERGLTRPTQTDGFPDISADDVHLVCYQVVSPNAQSVNL